MSSNLISDTIRGRLSRRLPASFVFYPSPVEISEGTVHKIKINQYLGTDKRCEGDKKNSAQSIHSVILWFQRVMWL